MPASGDAVFSKLSKLLDQENALSALCLRSDFCSPPGHPRGAQVCCGQGRRFLCHLAVAITRGIAPTSADAFLGGWRQMHRLERAGAGPSRAVVARRRRRPGSLYFHPSTVFGLQSRAGEDFFGNQARCVTSSSRREVIADFSIGHLC